MQMNAENQAIETEERWRQRYYDALAELENKERQWGELEALLRRGISRLSLVADGVDKDLDRQLERLRNIIRDERDNERIKRMIDTIAATADSVQTRRRADTRGDVTAVISDLAAGLPFPDVMDRKLASFRRLLQSGLAVTEPGRVVSEFTALLNEALSRAADSGAAGDAASAPVPPSKGGLFDKLLRRGDQQARAQTESAAGVVPESSAGSVGEVLLRFLNRLKVPDRLQSELALLKKWAAAAQRQAEYHQLADDIAKLISSMEAGADGAVLTGSTPREVLLQLIDSLSLPGEFGEKVETLRASLQGEVSEAEISAALRSIATLVADMRQRAQEERQEIEQFLKQLTERLQDLDRHLSGADNARAESLARSRRLQDAMREQVSGIEHTVRDSEDLESLKHAVQARVEAIRSHMDKYRTAEERRSRQSEEQIEVLTSRLHSLESEADELRKNIQHARVRALRDPLTDLPNRMAYEERLAQEFERWKRYQAPLTLVLWDLDHFKDINDTYGHKAGDKVLKIVGQLFTTQLRAADFTARYGGEEFVSLLPETDLATALSVAEKVRVKVESLGFHHGGQGVDVTVSGGVAAFRADDAPEAVFDRADKALYRAKQKGRNQCGSEGEG